MREFLSKYSPLFLIRFKRYCWRLLNRPFLLLQYNKIKDNPLYKSNLQDGLLRIRITLKCNAKCRWCSVAETFPKSTQKMSVDAKWLYDHCKPLYEKIKLLLITGGEPYVAKESYNYMKFISENYPHITIITESNGIAFGEKYRILAINNLFKTHFSINASNSEMYQKCCWGGESGKIAYEKALSNIKTYIDMLKEKNLLCFAPSLSMVVNKDNASDVLDFVKLALKMSSSQIVFYFDCGENNYMRNDYFTYPDILRPALKIFMELERVLAKKFFLYFRLWVPLKELEAMQQEVEKESIDDLKNKYGEILELAKNRSMKDESEKRNRIREQYGKKTLSFSEEWSCSIRMINIEGKEVCFAPWNELDIYPDGRIDFCGWFQATLSLHGFIKNNKVDWDKIINSPEYVVYRKNILNNDYTGCQICCPMNSASSEVIPVHKYGYDRIEG